MSEAVEVVIDGVSKRFGEVVALHEIHLEVHRNEFVSLLGPSGCGKTTLLRIVSGFEQPTIGRVLIGGRDVTDVPPHRRPTNIVFQRGALFPHMDVGENVGYSLKLRGWPRARIEARVEEMLALVRLEGLARRGPTELSGGQIQRVALARALAAEPSVLLLDEPLSALDLKLRQHMQLELRAIQRQLGATFVYVTHDQTEALVMSDRIAIMNEGRIVQEGSPREIYTRPSSVFASDFIGDTNLLEAVVAEAAGDGEISEGGPAEEPGRVALVLASGARVEATPGEPLPPGSRATLSVRPEAVRVRRMDAGGVAGAGEVPGSVAAVVYLGSRTRVEVDIGGGTLVWADLRDEEAEGLAEGTAVALNWRPSAASAWPASSDGGEA